MRTTVVLDDEVLECLQQESRVLDASFRDTLNNVIREGLVAVEKRRHQPVKFKVKSFAIGLRPGLSNDSISKLIEIGEGEDAR